jgi:hypothetical protein
MVMNEQSNFIKKNKILTKEDILNADDRKIITLDIPEWGGEIRLRPMTGYERDKFEGSNQKKGGGVDFTNIRARLASLTIVDEKGELIFNTPDGVAALGKKSGAALDRIFDVIQKQNAIGEKDIEDSAKN